MAINFISSKTFNKIRILHTKSHNIEIMIGSEIFFGIFYPEM